MTLTATFWVLIIYILFCIFVMVGAGDFDKHKDKY